MSNISQREAYESTMKNMLIKGVNICEERCIPVSSNADVNNYERACLGKCFDKFNMIYQRNLQSLMGALTEKKESEYDENF